MADLPEIIEQILIRLEVRDLMRCRSVSKSWNALISETKFIKAHLEHRCHREPENVKMGNRRFVMSATPRCNWDRLYDADGKIIAAVLHQLKELEYYIPTLVSPHVCVEPNRKRQEPSITESRKVPKLCLDPASSSDVGNLES